MLAWQTRWTSSSAYGGLDSQRLWGFYPFRGGYRCNSQNLQRRKREVPPLRRRLNIARKVRGKSTLFNPPFTLNLFVC